MKTRLLPPGRYYHFVVGGIIQSFSCRDTSMALVAFSLYKVENPTEIVKIRVTNSPFSR